MEDGSAQPWLTVIMPVHRGERWIEATLRSLAAETDDGVEVVVIDSSPTSATLDIVAEFADRLRLRFLPSGGVSMWPAKTNMGVEAARAEHVCVLHQDDLWLPGRAAAIRDWIRGAPDAALHFAPSAIVDGTGRTLGVWRCPFSSAGEIDRKRLLERLLVQNFIAVPAAMFRRSAWLACGGMDEALWYTCDWDVWLKLAGEGPVLHHPSVTTGFRIHADSQTVTGSRDARDFERQMRTVLDRHLPRLGARSSGVGRAGRASIRVNAALAAASAGQPGGLGAAAAGILSLGPAGIRRYLRDSRLFDRVIPRVRAKLAGAF